MSAQPTDRSSKQAAISFSNLDYSKPLRTRVVPLAKPRARAVSDHHGARVVFDQETESIALWNSVRLLMAECSATHRAISTEENVLGGIPHIDGTRISVGQALGRLYTHGSIDGVVAYYGGQVSADQIREAIAYAQDFIEAVCEPPETNG